MKNKGFIISSAVALLPIVLSAVLYSRLPEQLPLHYAINGTADGYASKGVIAFGIPILMCVLNAVVRLIINKKKNISSANAVITQWLFPVISVISVPIVLLTALK